MPSDDGFTTPEALRTSQVRPSGEVLRLDDVSVHFPVRHGGFRAKRVVHAVDGVSLRVEHGETLGVVGESGSGKTTLGYAMVGYHAPTAGRITFEGDDITRASARSRRALSRRLQMIYQDPYGALNPRMTVHDIVAEPIRVHRLVAGRSAIRERVRELLAKCGIAADAADRYPHAFSGGQRQRIVIARALAVEPSLLVADEPTSALDVSIQAQVVNLLQELQAERALSMVFISHDLSVVRHISHRIAIMYLGQVVEIGPSASLFEAPRHPYTQALLSAIPRIAAGDRQRIVLRGEMPSPIDPPSGCRFRTRCALAIDRCSVEAPQLSPIAAAHDVACWVVGAESSAVPVAVSARGGSHAG